jgi:glycosyltransferase involved in cell wall biosynthesis
LTFASREIHVLHLIGSTGLYGAERWVLALMRAIDTTKVRSTFINLVDAEAKQSDIVAAATQRGLEAFDFITGGKFNLFAAWRLARWVREQQVDIIHGHGFKSDIIGLLAARLAGCKVMTTPHGWSLEKDRKLKCYERLDRFSFQFMDLVCPLSPDLSDGLRHCVRDDKLKLIINGVDVDEVQSVQPTERCHSSSYLIGYIGQLIERKDMPTLLAAVKLLSSEGRKINLTIIGDGVKRDALMEETLRLGIDRQVEFLGFRTDAAACLKTFDVFVLPSRMEGIPRCIMEAMAASVPVVVSDIPGNKSLVDNGKTGLLFTVGDSIELADKIRYMMDHPDAAREMALCGKRKVEEEYSSRKMAREYTALYQELTAGRR